MKIIDYMTLGGKNVILDYIMSLPVKTKTKILILRKEIESNDKTIFEKLDTKKLFGKLYEIRLSNQRIAYVVVENDKVYFLHIFQKQKNKTEKNDINLAIERAKRKGVI